MKLVYIKGEVSVVAESLDDIQALMDFMKSPAPKFDKRSQKYVHKATCTLCGKLCKKGTGMASHMRACSTRLKTTKGFVTNGYLQVKDISTLSPSYVTASQ